jgi:hypothetical protein
MSFVPLTLCNVNEMKDIYPYSFFVAITKSLSLGNIQRVNVHLVHNSGA